MFPFQVTTSSHPQRGEICNETSIFFLLLIRFAGAYTITMNKTLFLLLICTLLLSSCGGSAPANTPTAADPPLPNQQESPQPALETNPPEAIDSPPTEVVPTDVVPTEAPLETLGPDCYGEEAHPIGQSIADQFPDLTEYEEVMVWFCNGFEFEDILTALQTAEETSIPAGELLDAFANGQTWEEIWVELGLVEP